MVSDYFNNWLNFWLPIYKVQVFKVKVTNDVKALLEIKENIYKNVHFSKEEYKSIFVSLEIQHLNDFKRIYQDILLRVKNVSYEL